MRLSWMWQRRVSACLYWGGRAAFPAWMAITSLHALAGNSQDIHEATEKDAHCTDVIPSIGSKARLAILQNICYGSPSIAVLNKRALAAAARQEKPRAFCCKGCAADLQLCDKRDAC